MSIYRPKRWNTSFGRELWSSHRVELLTVVTTIGFSVADHLGSSSATSLWSIGAVAILFGYLMWILREARQTTDALIETVDLPYSIVTDKPIEEAEKIFANHTNVLAARRIPLDLLFARLRISSTDWRYFDQNRLEDEKWNALVTDICRHFIRYSKRVPETARFNFFFSTPSAITLAFGAVIGRNVRLKVHQYFGPGCFTTVFDPEAAPESYHHLQHLVGEEYRQLRIESSGDPKAENVAIILQFVGHPLSRVESVLSMPVYHLIVSHQSFSTPLAEGAGYSTHLPQDHDWMLLALEISSLILSYVVRKRNVHVFFGLPAALSFTVGYILGKHTPIRVYHHDAKRDRYIHVFSLNEVG